MGRMLLRGGEGGEFSSKINVKTTKKKFLLQKNVNILARVGNLKHFLSTNFHRGDRGLHRWFLA